MGYTSSDKMRRAWTSADVADQGNFFEFVIERFIQRFCTGARCVIDAGANYGAHTATMLGAVGSVGQVFAFEPNPHLASQLEQWVSIHPNLTVLRTALSDRVGKADFFVHTDAGYGSLHVRPQFDLTISETVTVTTAALDDFWEFRAKHPVSFIKADVEGAEIAFLHGAIETLKRSNPLIVMELDWNFSLPTGEDAERDLFRFLKETGYAAYDFFGRELQKRDETAWNVILAPRSHAMGPIRDACFFAGAEFFQNYRGWHPYKKFETT